MGETPRNLFERPGLFGRRLLGDVGRADVSAVPERVAVDVGPKIFPRFRSMVSYKLV